MGDPAPRFKVQYDLNLTEVERLKNYGLRKAMRIAINRAAAGIKTVVESNAAKVSTRTGTLAKAQRIKVKVYRQFTHVAIIGPARNFKRAGKKITRGRKTRVPFRRGLRHTIRPGRYAHLVERGTKRSKASPFIKPSESAIPRFRDEAARAIAREIEKELSRQARG
jgi:hypothetical protein